MGTCSEMGERMPELPRSFLNFKQMLYSMEEMAERKDVVLSELTQAGEKTITNLQHCLKWTLRNFPLAD